MYSLLVLGLIPGTNISISFQAWLAFFALLLLGHPLYQIYHRHQLIAVPVRQPLPATRLHSRLHPTAR
jgi:hypothetical protein